MRVDGTMIKVFRIKADKSCIDLAKAADLGERRIQQIEKGELVNLNINIARAICKELGCKLIDIRKG